MGKPYTRVELEEAGRLARIYVKRKIRRAGIKLSTVKATDIGTLARTYLITKRQYFGQRARLNCK